MNDSQETPLRFRVAEVKEDPGNYTITRLDTDGGDLGAALRRPDGTFWEVAAFHSFPPGGGKYRIDLGAQITDAEIINVLESSYLDAMRQAAGDAEANDE